MADEAPTAEEAAEVERLMALATETVRKACEGYLGRQQDRESARAWLREVLFGDFPDVSGLGSLDDFQKKMATEAGVCLLESFLCGMPEGYDPRQILGGDTSDIALQMLEERFRGVLDEMPFTLIRYERLRRDGKIHDWQFKRTDETHAQVAITPLEPARFITVEFGKLDLEGVSDGE